MPLKNVRIETWRDFDFHIRRKGCNMLKQLNEFPNSIIITGCQRSGTSILLSIISESDGIDYKFGYYDELKVALILAGIKEHKASGRHCFQTTYLNECYQEHYRHLNGHKLIWVLRNPYSVIYSMLHNWDRAALHTLFIGCGRDLLSKTQYIGAKIFGKYGISDLNKACYSYVGKIHQAFEMQRNLPKESIIFVDYDNLVKNKHAILPAVYNFLKLTYKEEYAEKIHSKSVRKVDNLSSREKNSIERICEPIYKEAFSALTTR